MANVGSNGYDSVPRDKIYFSDFNLSDELLKGLDVEMHIQSPNDIQSTILTMIRAIPQRNLIVQAQSGCGKTLPFVLGMLMRIDPSVFEAQALCLCPSRHLANQILAVVLKVSQYTKVIATRASAFSYPQAHILIGTPDSFAELISLGMLPLSKVKMLVLDEGDQLLSDGFSRYLSLKVLKKVEIANPSIQLLLFTTTLEEELKAFAESVIPKLTTISLCGRNLQELLPANVKQFKVVCPTLESKIRAVTDLIIDAKGGPALVFVRKRETAFQLHSGLTALGFDVAALHMAFSEETAERILKEFYACNSGVLIAKKFVYKGFDHPRLTLALSMDLPLEGNERVYFQRVATLGRFGRKGAFFNFILQDDSEIMQKIEDKFGVNVTEVRPWDSKEQYVLAFKEAGMMID